MYQNKPIHIYDINDNVYKTLILSWRPYQCDIVSGWKNPFNGRLFTIGR